MSLSDFSPFMQSKRCDKCDWDKGMMSFEKGSNRCRKCVTEDIVEAHKQGIKTMRKCTKCEKEKDAVPNYYLRPSGMLLTNICNLCIKQEQTKRLYGDIIEVRCIKRFTFNYHKICDKCEVIKHEKDFGHSNNIVCTKCRLGRETHILSGGKNGGRPKAKAKILVDGKMECDKCHKYKELTDFWKRDSKISHNRDGSCKVCRKEIIDRRKNRITNRTEFVKKFNSMKEEVFV